MGFSQHCHTPPGDGRRNRDNFYLKDKNGDIHLNVTENLAAERDIFNFTGNFNVNQAFKPEFASILFYCTDLRGFPMDDVCTENRR